MEDTIAEIVLLFALQPQQHNLARTCWDVRRFGSLASVRVCPLSGRCGHDLRQGRDGPIAEVQAQDGEANIKAE
jgi:hypothetical protein